MVPATEHTDYGVPVFSVALVAVFVRLALHLSQLIVLVLLGGHCCLRLCIVLLVNRLYILLVHLTLLVTHAAGIDHPERILTHRWTAM